MRANFFILCILAGLPACSMELPPFLGSNAPGGNTWELNPDPPPPPVAVTMRRVAVEPALHGVILRVDGLAPAQGYWGAALMSARSPEPGVLAYDFVARPPETVEVIGPVQTREVQAGLFLPNRHLTRVRALRVSGAGATETVPIPQRLE
jgi:hypothetical protein